MHRILLACRNTWNGLCAAGRSEAAFRQELILLVVAAPLALLIGRGPWQVVALVGVVLLVMIVELLNTGLEKLADHVTLAQHPAIGFVKDVGSAAVGVALLLAGLVWALALAEFFGLI